MSEQKTIPQGPIGNPFTDHNDIKLGKLERDYCEIYLDVTEKATNAYGFVHGGAFFSVADNCAGCTARSDGRRYVTQDASVQYISNVKEGRVTARSKVLHRGRRTCLVQVEVRSEDDKLLFAGTFNFFCLGE